MVDVGTDPVPNNALFSKLAGFQAILPIFDNNSVVTPKFFLDSVDHVTGLAQCTNDEKLLILQSKIRGDALSHFINSPDLAQEKDYARFKEKFLAFFENKLTLATRQQQFSNCHMKENEPAKVYASRVTDVTLKFFGNINSQNADVKSLVEQTKLSKFLDGLLPDFKKQVLMKDPQTFQEALNFLELLQANSISSNVTAINNIHTNALDSPITGKDLLSILEAQSQKTNEMVASLTKQFEDFKTHTHNIRHPQQQSQQHSRNLPQVPRHNSSRHFTNNIPPRQAYTPQRPVFPTQRFRQCAFCHRTNHSTENCFFAPTISQSLPSQRFIIPQYPYNNGQYGQNLPQDTPRFHASNQARRNDLPNRFARRLND